MGTRVDLPLTVALLVIMVGLAAYTRFDLRDFSRFRKLTATRARQRSFRRWLLTSLAVFGSSTIVLLVLVPRSSVSAVREHARAVAGFDSDPSRYRAALAGMLAAFLVGAFGSLLALRKNPDVLTAPIAALIPRSRGELPWGAALSVNAGLVEELLFRLALPAALFTVLVPLDLAPTTTAIVAFGLSALLFGVMHYYQGVGGVILTLVLGLFLTGLYVFSESIVLVITLHALLDLRTLLVLPLLVGVHHERG